jgi:hypothetical protein
MMHMLMTLLWTGAVPLVMSRPAGAMRTERIEIEGNWSGYIDPNFNADAQSDPVGSEDATTAYFDMEQTGFDAGLGYVYEWKVHNYLLRQAGDPDSQNLTTGGGVALGKKVRACFEIFDAGF